MAQWRCALQPHHQCSLQLFCKSAEACACLASTDMPHSGYALPDSAVPLPESGMLLCCPTLQAAWLRSAKLVICQTRRLDAPAGKDCVPHHAV
jgi:hypothetical protein